MGAQQYPSGGMGYTAVLETVSRGVSVRVLPWVQKCLLLTVNTKVSFSIAVVQVVLVHLAEVRILEGQLKFMI